MWRKGISIKAPFHRFTGGIPQNHVPAFGYTVFDYVLMGCASKIGMMSHPGRQEKRDTERP